MQYQTYNSYKSSKIDWIEEVPAHWVTWKVTHGFNLIGSGTTPKSDKQAYYEDGEMPWITTSELRETVILDTKYKITKNALEDYSTLKVYKPGSLAFAMYGATIGRLGILGIDATVNQACCVFDEPEQFNTKFFFYWLWMRRDVLISLSVGGGQPNLSQDDLKQIRVPIPPVFEQQKIASFLDYKTRQIDQLIEKKKELIEKLEEQRIAVITQAVTKGIDEHAKLKPSGVDWLGDVPEHWGLRRLKFLSNESLQYGANEAAEMDDRDQPRFIRITDVKADGTLHDETFKSIPEDVARPFILSEGDILMARSGATVGKTFIYSDGWGIAAYAGYLIRFRVDLELMEPYFAYLFFQTSTFWANINSTLIQSTIQNFSAEKYANILMPVPPKDEQEIILTHTRYRLRKLDGMAKKSQEAIEKLEEYRSAIITSAVTGKIDVRDIVIPEASDKDL